MSFWGTLFPKGGHFFLGNYVRGGHFFLGKNVWGTLSPRIKYPGGHFFGGTIFPSTPAVVLNRKIVDGFCLILYKC